MLKLSDDKIRICVVIAIVLYLTLNLIHYYETRTQLERIVKRLDLIESHTGNTYVRVIDNNDRLKALQEQLRQTEASPLIDVIEAPLKNDVELPLIDAGVID